VPLDPASKAGRTGHVSAKDRRNKKMGIQIGDKVPDFKAKAYYRGATQEIELSHYQGHWVVLLFYPADFTFV